VTVTPESLTIVRAEIDAEPDPTVKHQIEKSIASIYGALRDMPPTYQSRVLIAAAVLLGRADDIVGRLTEKIAT